MDIEERDLVERAKSDPEAFGLLYDRYVDEVHRFVCARLHNGPAAEDVTADVFMSALRGMPRYRDQGRPFSCWLFRIAANAVATYYRRQQPVAEVPEEYADGAVTVDSVVIRKLEVAKLWQMIGELPPQQQQAMKLRFQEDLSARDAARIMRKSEAAVKLLIYRAVGRLRAELNPPPAAAPAA
jgi:RNA polymerase sigma-70 factor (ECF subfamily)